jgi:hypothetical protein
MSQLSILPPLLFQLKLPPAFKKTKATSVWQAASSLSVEPAPCLTFFENGTYVEKNVTFKIILYRRRNFLYHNFVTQQIIEKVIRDKCYIL